MFSTIQCWVWLLCHTGQGGQWWDGFAGCWRYKALFENIKLCVLSALKLLPLEVKWKETFIQCIFSSLWLCKFLHHTECGSHQTVLGCSCYFDDVSHSRPDIQYLIKSRKLDTNKRWESEWHGGQPDISNILIDKSCFTAASGTSLCMSFISLILFARNKTNWKWKTLAYCIHLRTC